MGDFSEHVLFGLLLGLVVFFLVQDFLALTRLESMVGSLAVFIGSVFPDIDHKNSYVFRSTRAVLSIFSGVTAFVLAPLSLRWRFMIGTVVLLSVYTALKLYSPRHRGFTHSFSFAVTLSSLAVIAGVFSIGSAVPGTALLVGLTSHLILDREIKF